MAVGYLSPNGSPTDGMTYDAMLYCKTNIGGYFFDGFMQVDHSIDLEVTENPVETGAAVVDHAYVKPAQVTMRVMMSDVHQSLYPGQFTGTRFRSTNAWHVLKKLQGDRIPFSIFTRLGLYENMLITNLSASDTADTFRALSATVTLREIPVARVKEVKISSASQTTINTEMGKIEASNLNDVDMSLLAQLMGVSSSG